MDKEKLTQYRALLKEVPKLKKDLDKLYDRLDSVPVISGKVTKSSNEHPYIEEHVTVQVQEPKRVMHIRRQIRAKEKTLEDAELARAEIYEFISAIPNSKDRQMFDLVYADGLDYTDAGEQIGYSKGRVSQKISEYLKD